MRVSTTLSMCPDTHPRYNTLSQPTSISVEAHLRAEQLRPRTAVVMSRPRRGIAILFMHDVGSEVVMQEMQRFNIENHGLALL